MKRRYHIYLAPIDEPMRRITSQPTDGYEVGWKAEKQLDRILTCGGYESQLSYTIVKIFTISND